MPIPAPQPRRCPPPRLDPRRRPSWPLAPDCLEGGQAQGAAEGPDKESLGAILTSRTKRVGPPRRHPSRSGYETALRGSSATLVGLAQPPTMTSGGEPDPRDPVGA